MAFCSLYLCYLFPLILALPTVFGGSTQVSVGCVERGRLMAQCWLALGAMLRQVLADREAALAAVAAAQEAAEQSRGDAESARRRALEECTALKAMMERHAGKVAEARRETEGWVEKHAKVGGKGVL